LTVSLPSHHPQSTNHVFHAALLAIPTKRSSSSGFQSPLNYHHSMRATQALHDRGQSIWLDNITRGLLTTGTLTLLAFGDHGDLAPPLAPSAAIPERFSQALSQPASISKRWRCSFRTTAPSRS
jgi:hypothetical protein